MLDLEERAQQPDRFKNRGGQLLREEKERKKIASQLPKIEQELLDYVLKYESNTGKKFLINGQHISDMINHEWEAHKENRVHKKPKENSGGVGPTPNKIPKQLVTPMKGSASKRKLITPLCSEAKKRKFAEDKNVKSVPKLQVNGSTIKKVIITIYI